MTIIVEPDLWALDDFGSPGASPPPMWEAVEIDERWWFMGSVGGDPSRMFYIGPALSVQTLVFDWEIVEPPTITGNPIFQYRFAEVDPFTEIDLGDVVGVGSITVEVPAGNYFNWGVAQSTSTGLMYEAVVAVGEGVTPSVAAICDEMGRATRAYVSAYDRSRVHQSRLFRFERRCFVANFNGAIPPARTIVSATWRTDAPYIGIISDPQISPSPDARESMVMFVAQLGGWANMRCDVTLDNGEIYNQCFRVNVREASVFFDEPALQTSGPFSVTVTA